MAWNDGYVTDLGYTYGYYHELNPVRAHSAILAGATSSRPIRKACELGFGQGLSTLIHAAAQPDVEWWGTDFNPSQARFAQDLAERAGLKTHLFDQSFAEFAARDDLPEFDFIALHGIWSWIGDADRRIIVDLVRRKLAVGGTLYISYNTQPGWAAAAPLRHLMKQGADALGVPGDGVAKRIDSALAFADKLMDTQPLYARANPQAAERLKGLKGHSREYLAHEYMNRNWQPMYYADMAAWLEDAKLTYVTSSNFLEHQDVVNMTPEQVALLAEIPDRGFRETVRDYVVGQQFRRDLWVKGPRKLQMFEHLHGMRAQRYVMLVPRADAPEKAKGLQNEVSLNADIYNPLFDFLAAGGAKTLPEIEAAGAAAGVGLPQVLSAIGIMVGAGAVAPAQGEKAVGKARATTDKLNALLLEQSRGTGDVAYLASPVTGGGVNVGRFDQLFLLARAQGRKTPAEWADFAHQILLAQGQKLIKNGETLATPEENLAELRAQAESLNDKRLAVLKTLGVV